MISSKKLREEGKKLAGEAKRFAKNKLPGDRPEDKKDGMPTRDTTGECRDRAAEGEEQRQQSLEKEIFFDPLTFRG